MVKLGFGETAFFGLDPRPFDAEPITVEPERGCEIEILFVAVITITRIARTVDERGRSAVLEQPGVRIDVIALALVARDGGTPQEAGRCV
jgi:hypothetical protein